MQQPSDSITLSHLTVFIIAVMILILSKTNLLLIVGKFSKVQFKFFFCKYIKGMAKVNQHTIICVKLCPSYQEIPRIFQKVQGYPSCYISDSLLYAGIYLQHQTFWDPRNLRVGSFWDILGYRRILI